MQDALAGPSSRHRRRLRFVVGHLSTAGRQAGPSRQRPSARLTATTVRPFHLLDDSAPALRNFDRKQFLEDGVYVWESVLTAEARAALREACERVQRRNDEWISFDWQSLDWEALRAASEPAGPPKPTATWQLVDDMRAPGWTDSDVAQALGCTHALPRRDTAFATHGYRRPQWDHPRVPVLQGYPPEMFAAGYDEVIMRCLTHQQMLKIHQQMLGDTVRFDHNTLLNRKAGFRGQGWHSHQYSEDDEGVTTRAPALGQVRTLCYPDGFNGRGDGGLKVVKGGHLYRESRLQPKSAAVDPGWLERNPDWVRDDELFEEEWLRGKVHPVTGEPLRITELELPPGSMVSCLAHAPHAVAPKSIGRDTRYCTLFCFAAPDPGGVLPASDARETWSLPIEFEKMAVAGEIEGVPAGENNLFTRY